MRRATFQLSVNFLVVLIICIVLFGIGLRLMGTFIFSADEMKKDVDEYHKRQLRRAMDEGALVATYPTTVTINRGDHTDFSLGISNELGFDNNFSVFVDEVSTISGDPPETLYIPGPYFIQNNEQYFTIIRIIIPRNAGNGTHIFNVYIYKNITHPVGNRYGDTQKLHVNIR